MVGWFEAQGRMGGIWLVCKDYEKIYSKKTRGKIGFREEKEHAKDGRGLRKDEKGWERIMKGWERMKVIPVG